MDRRILSETANRQKHTRAIQRGSNRKLCLPRRRDTATYIKQRHRECRGDTLVVQAGIWRRLLPRNTAPQTHSLRCKQRDLPQSVASERSNSIARQENQHKDNSHQRRTLRRGRPRRCSRASGVSEYRQEDKRQRTNDLYQGRVYENARTNVRNFRSIS